MPLVMMSAMLVLWDIFDKLEDRRRYIPKRRPRPMAPPFRQPIQPVHNMHLEGRAPNIVIHPPPAHPRDIAQQILDAVEAAVAIDDRERRNIIIAMWERIIEPESSWYEEQSCRGGFGTELDYPPRSHTPSRYQGPHSFDPYPDSVPVIPRDPQFPVSDYNGILPDDKFSEGDVAVLVAMDFNRKRAIHALRACEGDRLQALRQLRARRMNSSVNKAVWSRTEEPAWPVPKWDPDDFMS